MSDPQRDDYHRFFIPDGKVDPDFSAARNKAIVEQTITDYEALRAKKRDQYDDHYGERADAVVSFLKHTHDQGGGQGDLNKYFSKRMLAYLRGQEIRDQLMNGLTVINKDGVIVKR